MKLNTNFKNFKKSNARKAAQDSSQSVANAELTTNGKVFVEEPRRRKYARWSVFAVIVFAVWYFILPPSLGGRTLLLTTHGISMQPLLHQGDLAILRKQSTYKVGDVVQYHSSALNAPVLHRVISAENGTYSTKGDNNSFVDIDHPTKKQINGRMIHRYKGLGNNIGWIKSMPVRIIGALLVGYAVYRTFASRGEELKLKNDPKNARRTKRSGKGRKQRGVVESLDANEIESRLRALAGVGPSAAPQSPPGSGAQPTGDESQDGTSEKAEEVEQTETAKAEKEFNKTLVLQEKTNRLRARLLSDFGIGAFALIALVSLLFAVTAFRHPAGSPQDSLVVYNMDGSFSYDATAPGGELIYRDGLVRTGDPIFLSMVNNLSVTFDYKMDSLSRFKGGGTIQLNAVLKGNSGWSHDLASAEVVKYDGSSGRATAVINLDEVREITRQVTSLTKVSDGGYVLSMRPTVVANGQLGGSPINETFTPTLDFSFNTTIMRPPSGGQAANGPNAPTGSKANGPEGLNASNDSLTGLKVSKGGQVTIPAGSPQQLRTLGTTMAVTTLRSLSIGGLVLGAMGMLYCWRRRARNKAFEPYDFEDRDEVEDPIRQHALEVNEHQEMFIPVAGIATNTTHAVDVSSLDALVRLADNLGELILQEATAHGETFLVTHGSITYRYEFAFSRESVKQTIETKTSAVVKQPTPNDDPNRRFGVRENEEPVVESVGATVVAKQSAKVAQKPAGMKKADSVEQTEAGPDAV